MKYKSLIITLFGSSIFLATIICIWKIIATLQGLSFTKLNFNFNLLLSLGLTIISILIGNKFNHLFKIFILSLLFTILYISSHVNVSIGANHLIKQLAIIFKVNIDASLF